MTGLATMAPLRMHSQEIADLTGKLHKHVIRDIKKMLAELDGPNLDHVLIGNDARGYTVYIMLPRREVEILLTGYSTPLRAKVIDRLHELEALTMPKPAMPQTYLESLQELVKIVAAKDALEAENRTLANQNAMLLPAAEVGTAVAKRLSLGIVDFCRKLPGVSANMVQTRLYDMQYLHKRNGHWAPYSKFKGVMFDETFTTEGRSKVVVLEAGQRKLVELYHKGLLPMLKGHTPVEHLVAE